MQIGELLCVTHGAFHNKFSLPFLFSPPSLIAECREIPSCPDKGTSGSSSRQLARLTKREGKKGGDRG